MGEKKKEKKGQGSFEYLLLIGGAVLVAVIVIGWIVSTSITLGGEQEVQVKSQLQLLREQAFERNAQQEQQSAELALLAEGSVSVSTFFGKETASLVAFPESINLIVPSNGEISNFTATLHSETLTFTQNDCSIEYFADNTAGVSCTCINAASINCVQEVLSSPGEHYAEVSYNTGFLDLEEKNFTISLESVPETTLPLTSNNWSFENGPENISPWVSSSSEDYYAFVTDGFESEEFGSIGAGEGSYFAVTRGGSFSRTESLQAGTYNLCTDFISLSSSASGVLSVTGNSVAKAISVSSSIDYYDFYGEPIEPTVSWETACTNNINISSTGSYQIQISSSNEPIGWDNIKLRKIALEDCGNNVIDSGEECDGINFGGKTCSDFPPFNEGSLNCTSSCIIDIKDCTPSMITPPSSEGKPSFVPNQVIVTLNLSDSEKSARKRLTLAGDSTVQSRDKQAISSVFESIGLTTSSNNIKTVVNEFRASKTYKAGKGWKENIYLIETTEDISDEKFSELKANEQIEAITRNDIMYSALTVTPVSEAQELLTNPGFEECSNENNCSSNGWNSLVRGNIGGSISFSYSYRTPILDWYGRNDFLYRMLGDKTVWLNVLPAWGEPGDNYVEVFQEVPVSGGIKYCLSGYLIDIDEPEEINFRVEGGTLEACFDSDCMQANVSSLPNPIMPFRSKIHPLEDWQLHLLEITPPNDGMLKISLKLTEGITERAIGFDSISLVRGNCISPKNDDFFYYQWGFHNKGGERSYCSELSNNVKALTDADMDIAESRDFTKGNPDITIAMVDTGVLYEDFEELSAKIWVDEREGSFDGRRLLGDSIDNDGDGLIDDIIGWDFKANNNTPLPVSLFIYGIGMHGTVLSTVAVAEENNNFGIAGICPDCTLMPVRIEDCTRDNTANCGRTTAALMLAGIEYALMHDAEIINLAYARGSFNEFLHRKFIEVRSNDILVFAGAGNDGIYYDGITRVQYPASYEGVIGVGGSDCRDKRWNWNNNGSDYGPHVDVAAPFSTNFSYVDGLDFMVEWTGTSISTANAAAVAGLILSKNPVLSTVDVENILFNSAEKVGGYDYKYENGKRSLEFGYGRINALKALERTPLPGQRIEIMIAPQFPENQGCVNAGITFEVELSCRMREPGSGASMNELATCNLIVPSQCSAVALPYFIAKPTISIARKYNVTCPVGDFVLSAESTSTQFGVSASTNYIICSA